LEDGTKVAQRAICRTDNGLTLGFVGPRWTAFQPRDVRDALQELVDQKILKLHTAGSLRNGGRMWAQCTVCDHDSRFQIAPNDSVCQYYSISQGLDGLLAIHQGFTHIREVCENTMMAVINASKAQIRVRHHRNVADTVREVLGCVDWESQELVGTIEKYRFLTKRGVSRKDLRNYMRIVLDAKPELDWDDLSTRSKNIVQKAELLFKNGIGNSNPAIQGTWWAAYNAATQYLSHERGRDADTRLDSLWFGTGRNTLKTALDTAVQMADVSSVA
jgi:phage/plasmid-like protein (TIGR03299 family)